MPSPSSPQFNLTLSEKVMLRAFIQGTQLAEQGPDSPWTKEAITSLQEILDGTADNLPNPTVQDLLCIFTDLVMRKESPTTGVEFTRIMLKFMHHLINLIDWTVKKKIKHKRGRPPEHKVFLSVPPPPDSEKDEEIPHKPETT